MQAAKPLPLCCPDCAAQMPGTAAFCPGCGRSMHVAPRAVGKLGVLSENTAGAIAYLTFIPAIVFLLRPPYSQNRFVRFQSIQCLLFWLAAASLAAALRLAFLVLVLIPLLGPLFVTLTGVIAVIASLVIWAVLVVKALQGEIFRLPVLGEIAESRAGAS